MTLAELCAGTAALSLRLHARNARPPVARMGAKTGYADAILGLAGLNPGQRAERYVWAETDPVARRLLEVVADPVRYAALIEALRAVGDVEPRTLWSSLDLGTDVGAFLGSRWAFRSGQPETGFKGAAGGGAPERTAPEEARRLRWLSVSDLSASVLPSAHDVGDLPPGSVVYIDPPYVGTTGYGHDLPRSEVVALALRHADHLVMVSEAEPVAELVALGWHAVDITSARVGQKRTFSKQQREWVTMNRAPVRVPPEQAVLF